MKKWEQFRRGGRVVTFLTKREALAFARRLAESGQFKVKGERAFSGMWYLLTQNIGKNPLRKRTPRFPVGQSGAYAFDEGHVHIGKGLVYCKEYNESAPPVLTHSRVKCALCGKTIQSATNPKRKQHYSDFRMEAAHAFEKGKLDASLGRKFDSRRFSAPAKPFYKEGFDLGRPSTARSRRSLKNPPADTIRRAAQALVAGRVVTPETARRLVSETLTYGLDRLPGRARDMMKSALSYLPAQNPVPSYAMLLRTKLNQGYPEAEARGMAERELEQANIFLRMPRRNPARKYVSHSWAIVERKNRLAVHGLFDDYERAKRHLDLIIPEYVRKGYFSDKTLKADDFIIVDKSLKRNPGHGRRIAGTAQSPRLIYGRASTLSFGPDGKIKQMTSRKTSGPYKGKDFVHDFKPGVKHIGLPTGTKISTPDGQSFNLKTRTALMVGPKNLWADFAA